MDTNNLTAKIKGKDFKLKITLGFWKRCGFKREEAEIIQSNPEVYMNALKLAIFYGNKEEFGWESLEDMSKMLPDSAFEESDTDYAQDLSLAMVEFLPVKLRELIKKKMEAAEAGIEAVVDNALEDADQKKK